MAAEEMPSTAAEPTADDKGRPFKPLKEIAKHTERDNGVWMTIHNKVYDVTKYLDEHPGGEEVLMDRAGADASVDFEDVGHSKDARNQLAKFEIGELPPSERGAKVEAGATEGGGSMALFVVPFLVAAAGVGYYYTQMA